jgi:hypothetical protein
MLKKVLCLLLLAAFACLGATAAVAAIPHGHGHDLDHSQHPDCLFYKIGKHAFQLTLLAAVFGQALAAAPLFAPVLSRRAPPRAFRDLRLRGPPAFSL